MCFVVFYHDSKIKRSLERIGDFDYKRGTSVCVRTKRIYGKTIMFLRNSNLVLAMLEPLNELGINQRLKTKIRVKVVQSLKHQKIVIRLKKL
jgi:hypothetical protein